MKCLISRGRRPSSSYNEFDSIPASTSRTAFSRDPGWRYASLAVRGLTIFDLYVQQRKTSTRHGRYYGFDMTSEMCPVCPQTPPPQTSSYHAADANGLMRRRGLTELRPDGPYPDQAWLLTDPRHGLAVSEADEKPGGFFFLLGWAELSQRASPPCERGPVKIVGHNPQTYFTQPFLGPPICKHTVQGPGMKGRRKKDNMA